MTASAHTYNISAILDGTTRSTSKEVVGTRVIDTERELDIEVMSREIVFVEALKDITKGDRLKFASLEYMPDGSAAKATLGFLQNVVNKVAQINIPLGIVELNMGNILNGAIRGFEGATGVAQVRVIENQLVALRALEKIKLNGVEALTTGEKAILAKLNLGQYLEQGGREALLAKVQIGRRKLSIEKENGVEQTKNVSGVRLLFNAAHEEHLRKLYLENVDTENRKVNILNLRLAARATMHVAAFMSMRGLQAATGSVSWILATATTVGFAGYKAFERSEINTTLALADTAKFGELVAKEGFLGAVAKFFGAAERLAENEDYQKIAQSGDYQELAGRLDEGDVNAAIELIARFQNGILFNQGLNDAEVLENLELARRIVRGAGASQALIDRAIDLRSSRSALEDIILSENLRDAKRVGLIALGAIATSSVLRDLISPEATHAASQDMTGSAEAHGLGIDPKDEDVESLGILGKPAMQTGVAGGVTTYDTDGYQDDFYASNLSEVRRSLGIEVKTTTEFFTFDSLEARRLAEAANAHLINSRDVRFSNVFGEHEQMLRLPSSQGLGDGKYHVGASENLNLSYSSRFISSVQNTLETKGLIPTGSFDPEKIGYSVYVRNPDGTNQLLIVTRASRIDGIRVTDNGLEVSPEIHSKVSGVTAVYVHEEAGKVKNIYELARVTNGNAISGKPEFMTKITTSTTSAETITPVADPKIYDIDLDDPNAGKIFSNNEADLINDESMIRATTDQAQGHIRVAGEFSANNGSSFNVKGDQNLIIFNNNSDEAVAQLGKDHVDAVLGRDVQIDPKNIRWELTMLKDGKPVHIIVTENSTLRGVIVTDEGIEINPSVASGLVSVEKVYYGPDGVIQLDKLTNANLVPGKIPTFIGVEN